ncbi:hypothetical protein, unlikely [Trypanosoma brucei gambiense DAL972]|uniref:Uncharacterized protein n=1 Tax=Trypanosoma brucei gambiense (strain MHOM/CI/86/DAL972) TaxID=679716 RepID=C9ZN96_TRYB9|nr:hypothetical protein, unlikely [Trypanosoma brucei gambiense DAL972]CBH10874.1 hypothetical protein, unlikely [Trypanosoma brucei gambiense DAL972]|eukprot:XP_011773161.1 hypothetical protein, unlikely [Trypanosoma brucei gambiense DAL972]
MVSSAPSSNIKVKGKYNSSMCFFYQLLSHESALIMRTLSVYPLLPYICVAKNPRSTLVRTRKCGSLPLHVDPLFLPHTFPYASTSFPCFYLEVMHRALRSISFLISRPRSSRQCR